MALGGRQGGDIDADTALDLSSCVNPYGPPPSVIEALRSMEPSLIKAHPYKAAARLERAYAQHMDVDASELVGVRGASEAIWHFARLFKDQPVYLPLPTYTEYVRAFNTRVDSIDAAKLVVFSNPRNPSGLIQSRAELESLFAKHPKTFFLVDESYYDFVANADFTVAHTGLANVAVIRSPTKFYGLGGVRVGVVQCAAADVTSALLAQRTTWPVSDIDVTLVEAAFAAHDWGREQRVQLAQDAEWLDKWLEKFDDITVTSSPMHYRLVTGDVEPLLSHLRQRRVNPRILEPIHGAGVPALRISAPPHSKRDLLG